MTTGERLLAHFTESSTVSVSLNKGLDKILNHNPSAKISKVTICGGNNVNAGSMTCLSQGVKYGLMATTSCANQSPVGIISSLGIYLACSLGGPGIDVIDTVLRETVIYHATHLCERAITSIPIITPIFNIHPVDRSKIFSLNIAPNGEITVQNNVNEGPDYYESKLDQQYRITNEKEYGPNQPITRPVILTYNESKNK
ncbi:hypothetical protein HOH45_03750 [bacterium]|jgi:hypothetical protein|nr:hypothetical protein [bacterium]